MCPLCQAENEIKIYTDKDREYRQCQICQLIFVPSIHYLSEKEEKARYDTHQNSPDDPKYRAFLSRLFTPMQSRLTPGSRGLDFGSGPGPTLSVMFEEAGHSMAIYDHFYAPHPAVLDTPYDFITATEVVEHLHHPKQELERLWAILKPGGILGIMTRFVPDHESFAQWYYKNDPTHVCFFSNSTFEWLADQWHAILMLQENDVMLLEKKRKLTVRFVAMPHKAIEDTLSFADVTRQDVLYDLGCGEGDVLIEAATTRGTRCVGLDIDATLVRNATVKALKAGVHQKMMIFEGDFEQSADLDRIRIQDATVVILFLLPETLARLLPVLRERMTPGTRIISSTCKPIPDTWPADRVGHTTGFDIQGEPIPMYYWNV